MASGYLTRRGMVGLVGSLTAQAGWPNDLGQRAGPKIERTTAELAAGVTPTHFEYPELDARRYGVDLTGSTDSQPAIVSMLSVAENHDNAFIRLPPGSMIRCDDGLAIDTNRIGIDWQGSTIDFTRMKRGHAITFKQSEADMNQRPLLNGAHPIMNGRLAGPGAAAGVGGVLMGDTRGNLSGVKFRNMGFENFSTDVILDAGTFCATFDSCAFTQTSGASVPAYSITITKDNNGERNVFNDCFWFNRAFQVNALSPNSDTYFTNCSFDTFVTAFNVSAGMVFVDQSHIEGTLDLAPWGIVEGGAMLFIANTTIITQVDKVAFDMFISAAGNTNGGVFLDRIFLALGGHKMTRYLIGGAGNARVNNIVQPNYSARPVIGAMLNILAYGDFEDDAYANDWIFSGSILPSRTRTEAHGGSWSLQISGNASTAANPSSAIARRACGMGQYLQGEMWLRISAITGTGASFDYSVVYLDASNTQIGNSASVTSEKTDLTTWTRKTISSVSPAPAGTVSAALILSIIGTASGGPTAFVDDIVLNVF
jgi:hypothetical protein